VIVVELIVVIGASVAAWIALAYWQTKDGPTNMRFGCIAVTAALCLCASSPAAASSYSSPYKVSKGALRYPRGHVEQPFVLQVSPNLISISGKFRCSFYGPKGKPIGIAEVRVPPLRPGRTFSGRVSLLYSGDGHAETRCRFIEDQ
jgi:hypothetical protein